MPFSYQRFREIQRQQEKHMKNEVTVNGITLTRQQVEQAMVELNKPASDPICAGMRVQTDNGLRGVVVSNAINDIIGKQYGTIGKSYVRFVAEKNGHTYVRHVDDLKRLD